MAKDLSKYGIIPNKTGKEIFPIDKIPYNMYPHFLRGFFDGDGWFTDTCSHGKKELRRYSLGFVGNYKMLLSVKKYIKQVVPDVTDIKIYR